MTYSAAVFGVSMYFNAESRQMKRDLKHFFNEQERMVIQREKLRNNIDTGEIPNEDDDV